MGKLAIKIATGALCGLVMAAVPALADGLPKRGSIKDAPACCGWAGVYIGAFVGHQRSNDKWTSDETDPADAGAVPFKLDGVTAGGLIGANMQSGRWIWGVELDFGFLRGDKAFTQATLTGLDPDSIKQELNWNGHARVRFGLDGGRFMPFVAAGLAFADTETSIVDGANAETHKLWRTGLTVGGGVDFVIRDGWLGRVEFLHDRYGSASFGSSTQDDSEHFDLRTNTVRGAVILRLN